MFKIIYEADNEPTFPFHAEMVINEDTDDCTLSTIFAHFIKMTEIAGYHPGSWDSIIGEITDTLESGCITKDWAFDVIDNMYFRRYERDKDSDS